MSRLGAASCAWSVARATYRHIPGIRAIRLPWAGLTADAYPQPPDVRASLIEYAGGALGKSQVDAVLTGKCRLKTRAGRRCQGPIALTVERHGRPARAEAQAAERSARVKATFTCGVDRSTHRQPGRTLRVASRARNRRPTLGFEISKHSPRPAHRASIATQASGYYR
jgi:hypothetical protein